MHKISLQNSANENFHSFREQFTKNDKWKKNEIGQKIFSKIISLALYEKLQMHKINLRNKAK
jgi:hypothetical protein